MRFIQKNIVLASFLMSLLVSSLSLAASNNVVGTVHNLSVGGGKFAAPESGVTQVCIFCHTPHNALTTGPLWNKSRRTDAGAVAWKLYTSSSTLSTTVRKNSSLPANSPSLLCLSCHDGKTAMNILHNSSYGQSVTASGLAANYPGADRVIPVGSGAGQYIEYIMPAPGTDITADDPETLLPDLRTGGASGDDLTDDHPIGFSYTAAQVEKPTKLHLATEVSPAIRFYGPTSRIECSTCHNPHVDTSVDLAFKPFLVMSNERSALCLTCHDK